MVTMGGLCCHWTDLSTTGEAYSFLFVCAPLFDLHIYAIMYMLTAQFES